LTEPVEPEGAPRARARWWAAALLVLLPALVFSNSLENGYHLDDAYRIQDNPELERVWPPWRHFFDPTTSATLPTLVQWRPMLPLTLSVSHALSDAVGMDRLVGLHLGNLALHVAIALLLYLVFLRLVSAGTDWSRERAHGAALAGALLYAVHPVAGVPVNYLCARDLLLMQAFLAAAFLVHLATRERRGPLGPLAVGAMLALSIASKTNALAAFVPFVLYELLLGGRARSPRTWLRLTPALVPWAVLLWVRFGLGFSDLDKLENETSRWTYLVTQLDVHVTHYLRNAAWPFRMRPLPAIEPQATLLAPGPLVGAVVLTGSLAWAWLVRRRAPLATFCIAGYWGAFALTSSVQPLRYLATDYRQVGSLPYLCLGAALAIAAALQPRAARLLAACAVLYLGVAAHAMNRVWRDGRTLWTHAVAHGAEPMAHLNLAHALMASDDPADLGRAEAELRAVLEANPGNVFAKINLGLLWVDHGWEEDGLRHLREAAAIWPDKALTHHHLAHAAARTGRFEEAADAAARASDLAPDVYEHAFSAARFAAKAGRGTEALARIGALEAVHGERADLLHLEGFAALRAGEPRRAVRVLERLVRIRPDLATGHADLGHALEAAGRPADAIASFERGFALAPAYDGAHAHIARCLRALGDEERALEHDRLHAAASAAPPDWTSAGNGEG
jgi:tetratricopeptide (TPR) repeat protein